MKKSYFDYMFIAISSLISLLNKKPIDIIKNK